jgi:hypothetical protein
MRCRLVSKPPNVEDMRRRVRAALRKAEHGEELTERELLIVQWITSSDRCHACYERGRMVVVLQRTS